MNDIDLEQWFTNLFDKISEAANNGENFDLHLEAPYVRELADAYSNLRWLEIT